MICISFFGYFYFSYFVVVKVKFLYILYGKRCDSRLRLGLIKLEIVVLRVGLVFYFICFSYEDLY